jgi:gliding motility-associated-like protein
VDTILTVDSTAPISGLTEVCQFFTIPLTNTLGGGTWTSGNTAVATVGLTTGIVTGVTGGTATITYTITATGCKMVTVVTVHPKPVPPTITSQTVFCQFEIPTPLAASGSGLQWYGLGVTPPMTIAPTPVTDIARVDTYYVTQTVIGCVSDSTTVLVTIKPKPAPPITRDTMYCQYFDQAPALTAIGSGLKWYTASGTLLTSAPVPPTNFVGSTTWYVNQTVNGCTSDKTPLTVTIIIKPDFAIKASALKVCQFDTLVFSYDGPAMVGAGFLWDLPIGTAVTRGSIYDSVITVRFDTAWGTHSIFLTASNLNGMCFTTKQIDIKVIPQPFAHGYINPDICFGDTILLALSDRSANASTFTWLVDGTPLTSAGSVNIITANSSSGGPFLISFNDTGRHIIKLQASVDGLCPSKIEPDSINVHGLPDASFRILEAAKKLCLEDSVEFQATKIAYNYSYAWAPTHSFSNENKPRIWGRMESERSIVTLTVTDPFGCKASTDMELNPETCCSVFMPSAFSPNGDGLNDKYFPKFNGYHRLHIFRITNRWGQTVFENTNSDAQWDGTYNGVPQDMGVYFYYIKYDCGGKTLETKGDCTLVR